jgi:tyrosyl-tRNA synthetase
MSAVHAEAAQERNEAPDVFGLTHPLVSKADGTKFGKSEAGTIWLDATKTSPYRFYQFFIQTQDADVMTYLKFFTFLPHAKLAELEESLKTAPEKRLAQTTLAQEVTRLVHGEAELGRAEAATQALFGAGIRDLDEATLLDVLAGAPTTQKTLDQIPTEGLPLIDLLVETQLCPSKGQARKDLAAGGVYVNNERALDAAVIQPKDLIAGKHLVLRKGKKNYHLVSFA